eukprot:SAG11_NODE_152_length_14520_cov_49.681575_4_plen_1099_part_00
MCVLGPARKDLSKTYGALSYLSSLKRRKTHSSPWVRRFLLPADPTFDDKAVVRLAVTVLESMDPAALKPLQNSGKIPTDPLLAVEQCVFVMLDVDTEWEFGSVVFGEADVKDRLLFFVKNMDRLFTEDMMERVDKFLTDMNVDSVTRMPGPESHVGIFVQAAHAYSITERRVRTFQATWRQQEEAGFYDLKDRFNVLLRKLPRLEGTRQLNREAKRRYYYARGAVAVLNEAKHLDFDKATLMLHLVEESATKVLTDVEQQMTEIDSNQLKQATADYLAARAARTAVQYATASVTAAFAHSTKQKIDTEFVDAEARMAAVLPQLRARRNMRKRIFEARGRLGAASKVVRATQALLGVGRVPAKHAARKQWLDALSREVMSELVVLARAEDDISSVAQDIAEYRAVVAEMQEIRGKMYTIDSLRIFQTAEVQMEKEAVLVKKAEKMRDIATAAAIEASYRLSQFREMHENMLAWCTRSGWVCQQNKGGKGAKFLKIYVEVACFFEGELFKKGTGEGVVATWMQEPVKMPPEMQIQELREELLPLSKEKLRKRAMDAGIEKEELKIADASEDPQEAVIRLLINLLEEEMKANILGVTRMAQCVVKGLPPLRRLSMLAKQILAFGKKFGPNPGTVDRISTNLDEELEVQPPQLQQRDEHPELDGLKIADLRARALKDGVDPAEIKEAYDHWDPKAAIIELIVDKQRSFQLATRIPPDVGRMVIRHVLLGFQAEHKENLEATTRKLLKEWLENASSRQDEPGWVKPKNAKRKKKKEKEKADKKDSKKKKSKPKEEPEEEPEKEEYEDTRFKLITKSGNERMLGWEEEEAMHRWRNVFEHSAKFLDAQRPLKKIAEETEEESQLAERAARRSERILEKAQIGLSQRMVYASFALVHDLNVQKSSHRHCLFHAEFREQRSKLNAMVDAAATKLESTMMRMRTKSMAYASQPCRIECSHAQRKVTALEDAAQFLDTLQQINHPDKFKAIRNDIVAEEANAMEIVRLANPEYCLTRRRYQQAQGAYDAIFDASEDLTKDISTRTKIEERMLAAEQEMQVAAAERKSVIKAKQALAVMNQRLCVMDELNERTGGVRCFGEKFPSSIFA